MADPWVLHWCFPEGAPGGPPTRMQTSGRSWLMMVIRSSRGSYVMLSDVVYGPQATRTMFCSKSKIERTVRRQLEDAGMVGERTVRENASEIN